MIFHLFIILFLFARKLLGSFNYLSVGFVPALIASYVAILIEKKGRRGTLSLYMTNLVKLLCLLLVVLQSNLDYLDSLGLE